MVAVKFPGPIPLAAKIYFKCYKFRFVFSMISTGETVCFNTSIKNSFLTRYSLSKTYSEDYSKVRYENVDNIYMYLLNKNVKYFCKSGIICTSFAQHLQYKYFLIVGRNISTEVILSSEYHAAFINFPNLILVRSLWDRKILLCHSGNKWKEGNHSKRSIQCFPLNAFGKQTQNYSHLIIIILHLSGNANIIHEKIRITELQFSVICLS